MIYLHRFLAPLAGLAVLVGSTAAHAAMDPVIVAPKDGAMVQPTFTVDLTYGEIEYCDTDGCTDVEAVSVELWTGPEGDATRLASCNTADTCPDGMASFEVTLQPGSHRLYAIASDDFFSIAVSEDITVTVVAGDATTGDLTSGGDLTTGGEPTTGGGATDSTEGATEGATDSTEGPAEDTTSSTGGSDGAEGKDDGCGCRSAGSGSALPGLLLLALLARRRQSTSS